jgi:hypothetical protein
MRHVPSRRFAIGLNRNFRRISLAELQYDRVMFQLGDLAAKSASTFDMATFRAVIASDDSGENVMAALKARSAALN